MFEVSIRNIFLKKNGSFIFGRQRLISGRPTCIQRFNAHPIQRYDCGLLWHMGHQGKSKRRRLLCYAGTKSPSR